MNKIAASRAQTYDATSAIARFQLLADERTSAFVAKLKPEDVNDRTYLRALPYHGVRYVASGDKNKSRKCIADKRNDEQVADKGSFEALRLVPRGGDVVYFRGYSDRTLEIAYSSVWRGLVSRADGSSASIQDFLPDPELRPMNEGRKKISPAELLLGFVEISGKKSKEGEQRADRPQALTFAGRLRFSDALASNAALGEEIPLKVLDKPKPPSPALYFKHASRTNSYIHKHELQPGKHHIQGRKTYLHALRRSGGDATPAKLNTSGLPSDTSSSQAPWVSNHRTEQPKQRAYVQPVNAKSEFVFDVDFDDLTQTELELVCFALRPSASFRHKLGMGKSIGLGTVRIDIEGIDLVDREARYREQSACLAASTRATQRLNALNANSLAARYRESAACNKVAAHALEVLGDPARVRAPVLTPQLIDTDIEVNTYEWFVENSRENKDMKDEDRQCLTPIDDRTDELPLLRRLRKDENKPRKGDAAQERPPQKLPAKAAKK